MRRRLTSLLTSAVLAGGLAVPLVVLSADPATASVPLSRATYRDKTLAGILGQVGGVLTGYEYKTTGTVADACFQPTYGPYSGDAPASCWTPNGYPGYDRLGAPHFASTDTGSDDDYHIDFFDQLILSDHGPDPTYQDIKNEWVAHDVGDWGPGAIANTSMRTDGLIPPLTGQAEFNRHYWLTEPYIENDTLGFVAPGMPATARDLIGRFGSVTGEFDSVIWAKLLATMYSMAYFATDARTVLAQASVVLPRNSWPYTIYQKVQALHAQNPTDWRWAQGQLMSFVRNVYAKDNEMAIPDRNNGSTMLAILYGNNDYLTTLQIASLIGNDADCSASAAAGLMGVIKGMAGTPQEFKDRIYQNGAGRYVNDLTTGYPPNIKNGYPTTQTWDSLVSLYENNAAAQVSARGGSTDATTLNVNQQSIQPEQTIQVDNYDFEQGSLANWTTWTPSIDPGSPNAYAENQGDYAQSGAWVGTANTDASVSEIRLYTTLRGLQPGAVYRVNAFLKTAQTARLYVSGYGGPELYTSAVATTAVANQNWIDRAIEFTATGTTAQVGLHIPPGATGAGSIDNLAVERISAPDQVSNPAATRYEAEAASHPLGGQQRQSASASGGYYIGGLDKVNDFVQFSVDAPTAGEYRLAINFANATTGTSALDVSVNGAPAAFTAPFPRTEAWGTFSRNVQNVPVVLNAGANTIRLTQNGTGFTELDYVELGSYPAPRYAPETTAPLANPDLEADGGPTQTPSGWSTWPGTTGKSAPADYVEASGFSGGYRLTQALASAFEIYTDQTVTGLANGTYTLTAEMMGNGGHAAFLSAKNYATGAPELTAAVPMLNFPNWRKVVVAGIVVTNGQLTIGVYSSGSANQWVSADAFTLTRQ